MLMEKPCPSCRGFGELPDVQKPGIGDVIVFTITTAVMWTLSGMVTAIILYYNKNHVPTTSPTPEHISILVKILIPWAMCGFIMGLIALFHFVNLASVNGPISAYPVHLLHMSVVALIVGGVLGAILYPFLTPPPEAILRSIVWRIPICAIAALLSLNISLLIIPKIPKFFRS